MNALQVFDSFQAGISSGISTIAANRQRIAHGLEEVHATGSYNLLAWRYAKLSAECRRLQAQLEYQIALSRELARMADERGAAGLTAAR